MSEWLGKVKLETFYDLAQIKPTRLSSPLNSPVSSVTPEESILGCRSETVLQLVADLDDQSTSFVAESSTVTAVVCGSSSDTNAAQICLSMDSMIQPSMMRIKASSQMLEDGEQFLSSCCEALM